MSKVNNTILIIVSVIVLLFVGGLIGTSITGNPIFNMKGASTQHVLNILSECEIFELENPPLNPQTGYCQYECQQRGQTCVSGQMFFTRLLDPLEGEGDYLDNMDYFTIPLACGDNANNGTYLEVQTIFDNYGIVYDSQGFCNCCSV
ncbi:hypothetical protein CL616_02640 [archaeon]|nr:hypothetical protein [archaeon]